MSPERFEGAIGPDVRSDAYSLGVLLSELLAGEGLQGPERLELDGSVVHYRHKHPRSAAARPSTPTTLAS